MRGRRAVANYLQGKQVMADNLVIDMMFIICFVSQELDLNPLVLKGASFGTTPQHLVTKISSGEL